MQNTAAQVSKVGGGYCAQIGSKSSGCKGGANRAKVCCRGQDSKGTLNKKVSKERGLECSRHVVTEVSRERIWRTVVIRKILNI